MRVELRKLRPNPMRDFAIDPLEHDDLETLTESIREHDFWGGVIVRKGVNGEHQIMAGHKRIAAALDANIEYADLVVKNYDDEQAIRIYADENLTQRGITAGLAVAGAVAAALKFLIKGILREDERVCQICQTPPSQVKALQGNLTSDKGSGIGRDCIDKFFRGKIPRNVIQHHLANLRASGDYARLVQEARDEIAAEEAQAKAEAEAAETEAQARQEEEARKKAQRAKAKAEKASKAREHADTAVEKAATENERTFDLQGVGKYFQTEHQLRAFRKIVERENVKIHLPFYQQAKLAKELVAHAKKSNKELSGAYIEEYILEALGEVNKEEKQINKEAMAQMEREDAAIKFRSLSHKFCRNIGEIAVEARALIKMKDQYPDLHFTISQELRRAVSYAQPVINELAAKIESQK